MAKFNRRQLFRFKMSDLNRELGKVFSTPSRDTGIETEAKDEPVLFPRPPGAISEEQEFLDTCERCHACAGACPYEAISTYGPAMGKLEGTPFIDPAKAPCHWCEDMPCLKACPSGALQEQEPLKPIALISLDFDRCLVSQNTLCDTCSYRCPSHIRAITMVNRRPVLDSEKCTGCGMCFFHCEAEPSAFDYTLIQK